MIQEAAVQETATESKFGRLKSKINQISHLGSIVISIYYPIEDDSSKEIHK